MRTAFTALSAAPSVDITGVTTMVIRDVAKHGSALIERTSDTG